MDHRRPRANRRRATAVQRQGRAAIALLDWLATHGLDLASAGQGDLDTWLTSQPAGRREAGHFVRWAKHHKLTSLDFAATKWDGRNGVIDTEARWQHARRLVHDQSIKAEDRDPRGDGGTEKVARHRILENGHDLITLHLRSPSSVGSRRPPSSARLTNY